MNKTTQETKQSASRYRKLVCEISKIETLEDELESSNSIIGLLKAIINELEKP